MQLTLINEKYSLWLPDHRAARPEWVRWEYERIEAMLDVIKANDIVFDIGTEEGDISGLLANKTNCDMVLFEPNHKVWANVKAIWNANDLKAPLFCFEGFAGNEDKYDRIDNALPASADGELIGNHGFCRIEERPDIQRIKLDTFCKVTGIYPTVITMDIEGAEFEAIKGAEWILLNKKPILFISIHPEFMMHHYNQYSTELLSYICARGYSYKFLAIDHEYHFQFTPND